MMVDSSLEMGNGGMMGNWYEQFQGHLMKIGTELGYPSAETRDVIHQLFLDLLEKEIDTTSVRNPKAFLSTAFRRKLIDRHRKVQSKKVVPLKPETESGAEMSVQDILENAEISQELVSAIRQAYQELPERCKRVIDLKFYRGMSTGQIVVFTGLSKQSVYNNLFEGIKLLRAKIQRRYSSQNSLSPSLIVAGLILASI